MILSSCGRLFCITVEARNMYVEIQITLRAYPPTLQQHLHSLALLCLAYLGGCVRPNMFLFVVRPQAAKGREQSSPGCAGLAQESKLARLSPGSPSLQSSPGCRRARLAETNRIGTDKEVSLCSSQVVKGLAHAKTSRQAREPRLVGICGTSPEIYLQCT